MIKIAIADDHPIVRSGLKQIIGDEADLQIVGDAANGRKLLEIVRSIKVDVVVLDLAMPGMDGIDVLKQIKAEAPETAVIILTLHPEAQYALRLLRAGADGYVTKASATDELIKAVRKVHMGGKYIGPELAERIAFQLDGDAPERPHERLSDREYQVFLMLAAGKTVSEIADKLALSVKTVSTYRTRILEKTHLENNAEITRYAIRAGLIDI